MLIGSHLSRLSTGIKVNMFRHHSEHLYECKALVLHSHERYMGTDCPTVWLQQHQIGTLDGHSDYFAYSASISSPQLQTL